MLAGPLAIERRLAAILSGDVVGYPLTELNEETSAATHCSYYAVEESLISAHRGHIFRRVGEGVV
jgi:hypothetical protein